MAGVHLALLRNIPATRRAPTMCSPERPGRRSLYASEVMNEPSRYRVDVDRDGPRPPDDAGAGVLLRRSRPIEERAQHDDDEFHLLGVRRRGLGARRLFAGVDAG